MPYTAVIRRKFLRPTGQFAESLTPVVRTTIGIFVETTNDNHYVKFLGKALMLDCIYNSIPPDFKNYLHLENVYITLI